jgi:heme/copper-type cytochrome/quinol oxidase subunit 4
MFSKKYTFSAYAVICAVIIIAIAIVIILHYAFGKGWKTSMIYSIATLIIIFIIIYAIIYFMNGRMRLKLPSSS